MIVKSPNWNVNMALKATEFTSNFDSKITKLECKLLNFIINTQHSTIVKSPNWNVNKES